jgi:Ca2+-binding RTX toxin-like protein
MAIILGTLGDDLLDGTDEDDIVLARAGNDTVHGQGGNDVIGLDSGNDIAFGEAGDDAIMGGEGNDQLDGGEGDDSLSGGAGDDRLVGGAGNDRLQGHGGDDDLRGGLGDDQLVGGDGDDYLDGGGGANILYGGAGNDTIAVYSRDQVAAGDGDDLIEIGGYDSLDASISLGRGADSFTMDYSGGNQEFAGGGRTVITDFRHGEDQIGTLRFVITDDDGIETIGLEALDSNADGVVGVGDAGVNLEDGGLTIDLAPALTELASVGRPGFEVTSPMILRLMGVMELSATDFGGSV